MIVHCYNFRILTRLATKGKTIFKITAKYFKTADQSAQHPKNPLASLIWSSTTRTIIFAKLFHLSDKSQKMEKLNWKFTVLQQIPSTFILRYVSLNNFIAALRNENMRKIYEKIVYSYHYHHITIWQPT